MQSLKMNSPMLVDVAEAEALIPVDGATPIRVFATQAIRDGFDDLCLRQAINTRRAPGVQNVVLNPDAHAGYGAPVGCVVVSPDHIYPGPVGVDIKCSMSLLQLDLPEEALRERPLRRALINAICERTPTGAGRGSRHAKKGRYITNDVGRLVATEGATPEVCEALGIPVVWTARCEDSSHAGHDGTADSLRERFARLAASLPADRVFGKLRQLGSYGGGNHFGECNVVRVEDEMRDVADAFGLRDGNVSFLSHCGSRGFGYMLADAQFRSLQEFFRTWSIPFPGGDRELVYAPLGTRRANEYLDDMAMGGNFAIVNHLLINALVLEAFQEVLPGTTGRLVYYISHNFARREVIGNREVYVHRKGATRAYPAGHFSLKDTPFHETGHPILLPGNPRDGSVVMVAQDGAERSCFSVNHGAGRALSRTAAIKSLDQDTIDAELDEHDILSNRRRYPRDEAPAAYKDFGEVVRTVKTAGLAKTVARLRACFVLKDSDRSLRGQA
ncbi:RtcB family protein [bacterium]|nr:RtcB family protein [bacterium]